MRKLIFGVAIFLASALANIASAQQTMWVQIEAQRSLGKAQDVARAYAGSLQQVSGFAMRSGWYAIALGPFSPIDAEDTLRQLRITRQIPGDSYIVDGSNFRRQFWPIGGAATIAQPAAPGVVAPQTPVVPAAPLIIGEETVAQARRSERELTREERELIQTALKWEGFYTSAIDGAIGPGTRKSMAAWQRQEGIEETGVLTTAQRRDLVTRYTDMLASMGMALVVDNATGIKINLPTAMVEFDRYEPPFAHFSPKGDSDVKVLLISQTGDDATLRGLYDIMQTLEIVPLEGQRNIGAQDFTLTGRNDRISSYTYAALENGHVKGFTVIWPTGADKRRDLVINEMKTSLATMADNVLPDVYGDPNAAQSLDLLAGLTIRHPDLSRSGFYVDNAGAVLTTAEIVASCERITLDDTHKAQVSAVDQASGLALLRPEQALSPIQVAQMRTSIPRIKSEIAVSGYSYGGILGAPTLTYGTLADLSGLKGEPTIKRLALDAAAGDAGGPVFDSSGAVIGMLLPSESNGNRTLPEGVNFAADTNVISAFLSENGVEAPTSEASTSMAPEDLTLVAGAMTVLVSCWN